MAEEPSDELAGLKLDIESQWAQERLRATLVRARELLEASKIDEAIALLAAAGSESPEVSGLLAYAQERKRAAAIRAEIEKVLVDSARLADAGRLDEALQVVEGSVSRFTGDTALLRLRDTIRERIRAVAEINRQEEERRRAEAEARKRREEEAARARAEAEQKRKEEAERKRAEEEARKRREEETAQARAETEQKRKEEAERKRAEEEARKHAEEGARKRREEEAARARAEAERRQKKRNGG